MGTPKTNESDHRYSMTLKQDMSYTPPTRQRPLPPPNRRRDKIQLSCNLCRRRKVKCDRQQPCKTCSLRGLAMSCTYPPDATSPRPSDRDSSTVQNRIRELESLVHILMQRAASKTSNVTTSASPSTETSVPHTAEVSPDSSASGASGPGERPSCGMLTLTNNSLNGVNYVDGAHWSALLDNISELKDCFPETTEPSSQFRMSPIATDYGPSPQLLYGTFPQISKAEILNAIPTRPVVDRMVSRFFNMMDLAPAIIHKDQFIRQYGQFWEDPFAAPITWLGLLFAMMCVATLLNMPHTAHDFLCSVPPDSENAALVKAYREKIVQCLTLGKYTKGGPFVLETLLCYLAIEHLFQEDPEFGTHILLGMIIHLAMRMGYHRDPKNFPVISVFDGEMRRRTWAAIYQANLIFASQMGLPSMLKEYQIDTEEPRNLTDADFGENITELPPSRPDHELTPVTYIIIRSRIASLWEKVRDIATDTRVHKYEEILAVDQSMAGYKDRIPPGLRMQSIAQSITDSPQLIMQRVWLEICFLRLKIVLHKNYFMAPNHHERYKYSRGVSIKSAMKVIEYQHMIYELVVPDGLLYDARWKLSSVMNNEFLLATTIMCAYIKQLNFNPQCAVEGVSMQEITQLLEKSLECWERFSSTSSHARKAMEAIRLVLKAANTPAESPIGVGDGFNPSFAFQDPFLLDLNFPCTLESFYNEDSSTSVSEPSLDSASFCKQQNIDDEWINMFERVSTRQPD